MEILLGGRYTNEEGQAYSVLDLCDLLIKVMYTDGSTKLITRPEHLRALREVEKQRALEHRYRQHLAYVDNFAFDYFTAGFLAVRGFFYARVPPDYEQTFIEDHVKVTGHRPDEEHYHIVMREDAWQALSTYIEFPHHDELDFGELEITEQPNKRWRVCSNRFFWALLLLGFRLGSKQDIEGISKAVYMRSGIHGVGDFERGIGAGRASR